jgi:hypothetical protein
MSIIGNPRSFHKKFKFVIEADEVKHTGFQKCSELAVEIANVQYNITKGAPSFPTRARVG